MQPCGPLQNGLAVQQRAPAADRHGGLPGAAGEGGDAREHADLARVHQEERWALLVRPPHHRGEGLHLQPAAVLPGAAQALHVEPQDVLEGLHRHPVLEHLVREAKHWVQLQPLLLALREVLPDVHLHGVLRLREVGEELVVAGDGAAVLQLDYGARRDAAPQDPHAHLPGRIGELAKGLGRGGVQAVELGAVEDEVVDALVLRQALGLLLLQVLQHPACQLLRGREEDVALQADDQHPAVGHVLDLLLGQGAAALEELAVPAAHGLADHAGNLGVAHDEGDARYHAADDHRVEQRPGKYEDSKDHEDLEPLGDRQVLP
mmetsp:Transcript_120079/g.350949  ORF Transcript_120079/g.350949 Transcript_120079/m.350949 type:complete len:319 (+) Transcript_120079:2042-2998(+)